ncbi:SPOR domain-containing protein [uncultured Sphingomonas sp.]|uniref:SPOR domain-containing protein n=1 Tax=uncultured Sphingomonas sp. TaxID=158754 RepID=UPI0026326361|nr:SPOR domain-containing protein [uncultured Sphingomonas sp.]
MTSSMLSRAALALALALAAPSPLLAQEVVQPLPGTTEADRLGEVMRRVAARPTDVDALVQAGEMSLHLDDMSGAASLFARAQKVSPSDPRVKAGMASILVRSERPGEALRYFTQAESMGLPVARMAADRGFAYDLIGEQERAQRDYRTALQNNPEDETRRRYALSLGISGKRDEALAVLDPLLRSSDRAAWRARAFILAMTGDQAGAVKIATTMMPPQLAQGIQPFFQRLPTLNAVDRAFAVHFGELLPTPERIADARLAPALTPLPAAVATPAPVALAAVQQPAARSESRSERRRREREEQRARRVEMAAQTARPTAAPVTRAATPMTIVQPLPQVATRSIAAPSAPVRTTTAPAQLATVQPLPQTSPAPVAQTAPVAPVSTNGTRSAAAQSVPVAPVRTAPVQTAMVQPLPRADPPRTAAAASPTAASSAATAVRDDSVLARIVAGLSIPAAELGVEGPVRAVSPVGEATEQVLAEAKARSAQDVATRAKAVALIPDAEDEKPAPAKIAAAASKKPAKPEAEEPKPLTAAEKKAAAAKAAAEKKAVAEKKAAAEKKALAAKEAAEEKKLARANPARIWVQVAGGANANDLPKAWSATKSKAASAFAGKQGYSTPLRATNRVLTGPFKTDAEARAFVNTLSKQGVSAFTFTSDAGQVVTKLPTK